MYSRNHTPEDYGTFVEWWQAWDWQPVPYEFIPQNSVVVCRDNGEPVCAVFLYKTDTPICWAENYISERSHKKDRQQAMSMMLFDAEKRALEMGAKLMMSSIYHKHLAARLKDMGYIKADEGLTNFVKVL